MIKKILLFLLFFCYCAEASADFMSFWKDMERCFEDPCNCGDNRSDVDEEWDGKHPSEGKKKNSLCPPWNKEEGRLPKTCLLKTPFPDKWIGYYENLCAEATPENTYLEPKIRVRGQQCNAFGCWTTNNTLNWDGECVTLAGGYGFPLHRMCARVALPADPVRGWSQDPGYTNKKHLNYEGGVEEDEPIITAEGEKIILEAPKLCLYYDPSFVSAEGGFDIMDVDPIKQPFHKTTEMHPVVKIIIFIINNATDLMASPITIIKSLIGSIDSGDEGETTFSSVMNDIFSFLGDIIEMFQDSIKDLLEMIGKINNVVDSKVYGCVNLKMGPYPPPYCESVTSPFQSAKTQYICHIGADGLPVPSKDEKKGQYGMTTDEKPMPIPSEDRRKCVVSTLDLRNNYIRNSIRVGYDNFVPLCKNPEDALTSDKCVAIKNFSFASASLLHSTTDRRDILKPCSGAADDGTPCINTKIPHQCSSTKGGCQDGFRIVYATKVGAIATPQAYYRDDLDDCGSTSTAITCQMIWGINTGEFIDQHLNFPGIEQGYKLSPLSVTFTLKDKSKRVANFRASIVRESRFDDVNEFYQESSQICVFEEENLVGCEPRAPTPKILLSECGSSMVPGVSCPSPSSHFSPKFIASYKSSYKTGPDLADMKFDSTSAVIEPANVYPTSSSTSSRINLAGDTFESFVTDDTFKVKPFSMTDSSINPSSLLGTYKDDILPIEGKTFNANALYMSGLEYINGKYHVGGKYACLSVPNEKRCPENPNLCVLTNLLNRDTVECKIFKNKSITYGGLTLCSASETSTCEEIDSMPNKSGSDRVIIRSCSKCRTSETSTCAEIDLIKRKCYDGTVELCRPSTLSADRIDPKAYQGDPLSDQLSDDDYYPLPISPLKAKGAGSSGAAPSSEVLNANLNTVRDKTFTERGLCVLIPQKGCAAETASKSDGTTSDAHWTAAPLGGTSYGTCPSPYWATGTMERKCIADPSIQQIILEPLVRIERDAQGVPQRKPDKDRMCVFWNVQ